MKKNQPKKKISNEPVRKVIEKRFDMYPYEGNDEFEELKEKTKELEKNNSTMAFCC